MSNYKIAVLGDKDSVLGFKALGLDVFPAESAEEAKRTLHALAKENYAVVYLTRGTRPTWRRSWSGTRTR